MPFDTSDPAYQDLLAKVVASRHDVVPFVGAGLSVYGPPEERLPLWRELLDRLIREGRHLGLIDDVDLVRIERARAAGRLIEATDVILDLLGDPTFRRVVETELDDRGKPLPPAVAQLVAIGWSLIVTTNLDRLIARAYHAHYGKQIKSVTSIDLDHLARVLAGVSSTGETWLAKIHGDIDSYRSWQLTTTHYRLLRQHPGYVDALKNLFLRRVFFVGFGLNDEDIDFVLDTVARVYPQGASEFFALIERTRRSDPDVQALIRNNGLRPIFYDKEPGRGPSDPFGEHRQVFECLSHLAEAWAKHNAVLDVTMKFFPEPDPWLVGRDAELAQLKETLTAPQGGFVQLVGLGGVGKTSLVQDFVIRHRAALSDAGYRSVFGYSFHGADMLQFLHDLESVTVGRSNAPAPEVKERVAGHLRRHKTLLVIDGTEAILTATDEIRSPYLAELVRSALDGGGSVVATSRIPIGGELFEAATTIDLAPLDVQATSDFLSNFGLGHLGRYAAKRMFAMTGGHPLALRILAAALQEQDPGEALSLLEESDPLGIVDEVDPLQENRLARILESYRHLLDPIETDFMRAWAVFDAPAPYALVDRTLGRPYPDSSVTSRLADRDLREIVIRLRDLGLVNSGADGLLSSHPTVREFFGASTRELHNELEPLHRMIIAYYLDRAAQRPGNFDEAKPLMIVARHAAAIPDWSLFDDIFRNRLMRGFRSFLCNNLGGWDEALALARLGDSEDFPARQTREPAYYPITVARCLKHLGRSAESRRHYLSALRDAAATRDPDAAKYVNNFLTLLIWRGELGAAESLVEMNVRALDWIDREWKRRWQVEHGFSSFGYLRLLRGQLRAATDLFTYSMKAWDGCATERLWMYDYYPYHRAELQLLVDPTAHADAGRTIEDMLAVAREHNWPESMCRGEIHAAAIAADRARLSGMVAHLRAARDRLERARSHAAGLAVADVRIALLLCEAKIEIVQCALTGVGDGVELLRHLGERIRQIVEMSGLRLAEPELGAVFGAAELLHGNAPEARAAADAACQRARERGDWLSVHSPRSVLHWLLEQLGSPAAWDPVEPVADPRTMNGASLQQDWMLDRLAAFDD